MKEGEEWGRRQRRRRKMWGRMRKASRIRKT